GPLPQALWVPDIAAQKGRLEILGGAVGQVQVRAELCVAGTVESVAGHAILLEQGEALADRVVRGQVRGGAQDWETFGHRCQATNAGDLEGRLLRADAACLWVGPDQVEGAGSWFVLA